MTWPFADLRTFGYQLILADPPWTFDSWSHRGAGRCPQAHYDTLNLDQIRALPVGDLAQRDCALFLWCVDPLLDRGFDVLRAWGFRYVSVAFTWAKRTKLDQGWHMGAGYTTRANPETCLLGVTGQMRRHSAAVRQLVVEPVREHSRKPDRIHDDIVRLYGDLPRCELFSRQRRDGWDTWGNELDKFDAPQGAVVA